MSKRASLPTQKCPKCKKSMQIYDTGLHLLTDRVYFTYKCGAALSAEGCGHEKTIYARKVNGQSKEGNHKPKVITEVDELEEKIAKLGHALMFYAMPETYIAVGFRPDPPCGDIMDDFSDTGYLGHKPGKLARETMLDVYGDEVYADRDRWHALYKQKPSFHDQEPIDQEPKGK